MKATRSETRKRSSQKPIRSRGRIPPATVLRKRTPTQIARRSRKGPPTRSPGRSQPQAMRSRSPVGSPLRKRTRSSRSTRSPRPMRSSKRTPPARPHGSQTRFRKRSPKRNLPRSPAPRRCRTPAQRSRQMRCALPATPQRRSRSRPSRSRPSQQTPAWPVTPAHSATAPRIPTATARPMPRFPVRTPCSRSWQNPAPTHTRCCPGRPSRRRTPRPLRPRSRQATSCASCRRARSCPYRDSCCSSCCAQFRRDHQILCAHYRVKRQSCRQLPGDVTIPTRNSLTVATMLTTRSAVYSRYGTGNVTVSHGTGCAGTVAASQTHRNETVLLTQSMR